jgi:hypothetical protein
LIDAQIVLALVDKVAIDETRKTHKVGKAMFLNAELICTRRTAWLHVIAILGSNWR